MNLTQSLRDEYHRLFDSCEIHASRLAEIDAVVRRMNGNDARIRYAAVETVTGVPWFVVGLKHQLEASGDFTRHLHNGDPLTARTRQVPAGRPRTGSPPFTWGESAVDALTGQKLDKWTDWSLPGTLYVLERYNGWGYRLYHPEVKSPYLWAFSLHYQRGKYIADGTWSSTAVSAQIGAAVLLRRLVQTGFVSFVSVVHQSTIPIRYSIKAKPVEHAESLQRWLNTLPGISLLIDGKPGARTSEAVRRVLGSYLPGDPRA